MCSEIDSERSVMYAQVCLWMRSQALLRKAALPPFFWRELVRLRQFSIRKHLHRFSHECRKLRMEWIQLLSEFRMLFVELS